MCPSPFCPVTESAPVTEPVEVTEPDEMSNILKVEYFRHRSVIGFTLNLTEG